MNTLSLMRHGLAFVAAFAMAGSALAQTTLRIGLAEDPD